LPVELRKLPACSGERIFGIASGFATLAVAMREARAAYGAGKPPREFRNAASWLKSSKINGRLAEFLPLRRSHNVPVCGYEKHEMTRKTHVKNPSLRFYSCAH
jgi:hypothetical protein